MCEDLLLPKYLSAERINVYCGIIRKSRNLAANYFYLGTCLPTLSVASIYLRLIFLFLSVYVCVLSCTRKIYYYLLKELGVDACTNLDGSFFGPSIGTCHGGEFDAL